MIILRDVKTIEKTGGSFLTSAVLCQQDINRLQCAEISSRQSYCGHNNLHVVFTAVVAQRLLYLPLDDVLHWDHCTKFTISQSHCPKLEEQV